MDHETFELAIGRQWVDKRTGTCECSQEHTRISQSAPSKCEKKGKGGLGPPEMWGVGFTIL